MPLDRRDLVRRFPWLAERNLPMIVANHLDGVIAAAMMHHHLGWNVAGFYDGQALWLGDSDPDWSRTVWLGHQVCRAGWRSIDIGRIMPQGTPTNWPGEMVNPNFLVEDMATGYPFSLSLFLLWVHQLPVKKELLGRLLLLYAGESWLRLQQMPDDCRQWRSIMPGYNWGWLLNRVDSELFDKRMSDQLFPLLNSVIGYRPESENRSKFLKLGADHLSFNPDWDLDVFLRLGGMIGTHLHWSPPPSPILNRRMVGQISEVTANNLPAGYMEKLAQSDVFSCSHSVDGTIKFTRLSGI